VKCIWMWCFLNMQYWYNDGCIVWCITFLGDCIKIVKIRTKIRNQTKSLKYIKGVTYFALVFNLFCINDYLFRIKEKLYLFCISDYLFCIKDFIVPLINPSQHTNIDPNIHPTNHPNTQTSVQTSIQTHNQPSIPTAQQPPKQRWDGCWDAHTNFKFARMKLHTYILTYVYISY
jgi:hypothetical protein